MSLTKVWSRFFVTKSDGTVVSLRIQDLPSERFEDAMDFNLEYFVKYESFHKAAGVDNNPEALRECREFVSQMMKDPTSHLSICCRDDSETVEEILGVSSMCFTTDDEDFDLDDLEFKTPEWKKFFDLMEVTHSLYDVMKELKVKSSYDGRGIAVHPHYRGLGIATEFCKARLLVCKERGVPLTWACMTAVGSQKAAQRAGWVTAFEVSYAELEQRLGVSFEGASPYFKIMYFKL